MGIRLIKISVIYLMISTLLAMYISITENMTLSTVHSHISCLGWAMLALSGLVYHLFPELEKRVLSKIFFWLFNIGLPVMMIGVSFYLYDQSVLIKVVISIGAIPTSIGIILFAINVLIDMKNKKVLNSV
jgi:cbb3-type cytochrome oxidase subunit 1